MTGRSSIRLRCVTVAENGMVIKYVYGNFIPGDVEMALAEAKSGIPALSVKRLLNFCFNYDPDKNKTLFQVVKVVVLIIFGCPRSALFQEISQSKRL